MFCFEHDHWMRWCSASSILIPSVSGVGHCTDLLYIPVVDLNTSLTERREMARTHQQLPPLIMTSVSKTDLGPLLSIITTGMLPLQAGRPQAPGITHLISPGLHRTTSDLIKHNPLGPQLAHLSSIEMLNGR